MNEPIGDTLHAVEPEPAFKSDAPLIPRDSVAGRALVVVIAIMTFLACLTAGAALLIADASRGWRADVVSEATIQVKPRLGDDADSLVAKAVGDRLARAGRRECLRLFESGIGEASRALARQRARSQPTADPSPYRRPIARPARRGSGGAAIGSRSRGS